MRNTAKCSYGTGDRGDRITDLGEMMAKMEGLYGKASRVWVFDRGVASEKNLEALRQSGGSYLVGTPRTLLRKVEAALLAGDWKTVREGILVKLVPAPDGSQDTFILCRSADLPPARRARERPRAGVLPGLRALPHPRSPRQDQGTRNHRAQGPGFAFHHQERRHHPAPGGRAASCGYAASAGPIHSRPSCSLASASTCLSASAPTRSARRCSTDPQLSPTDPQRLTPFASRLLRNFG